MAGLTRWHRRFQMRLRHDAGDPSLAAEIPRRAIISREETPGFVVVPRKYYDGKIDGSVDQRFFVEGYRKAIPKTRERLECGHYYETNATGAALSRAKHRRCAWCAVTRVGPPDPLPIEPPPPCDTETTVSARFRAVWDWQPFLWLLRVLRIWP